MDRKSTRQVKDKVQSTYRVMETQLEMVASCSRAQVNGNARLFCT